MLLALVVAAFAYYVWPTPWTYYQCNPSVGIAASEVLYARYEVVEYGIWLRVNRFTGKVERLSLDTAGWEPSRAKR